MFRILSGILTIGNLEFATDDEGFTRQNFDEEKARNQLAVIAVGFDDRPDRFYWRKFPFFSENVWRQFRSNHGMFNHSDNANSS